MRRTLCARHGSNEEEGAPRPGTEQSFAQTRRRAPQRQDQNTVRQFSISGTLRGADVKLKYTISADGNELNRQAQG